MPPAIPPKGNVGRIPPVTPAANLRKLVGGLLQDVTTGRLLVASDFDGTLSPIVARPEDAVPKAAALAALKALLELGVAVAVVSGRSRAALAEALPLPGLVLLGDYGLEEPSAADLQALRAFNEAAAARIAGRAGVVLERKPGSTSVHYRDNPPAGETLLRELAPLAAAQGLRAGAGRMVVEVRPPGADKGAALARLVERLRPAAVAFAGDDEGDRSAFEVAARQPRHLVVGVTSAESRPDLFQACDAVVGGPDGWVAVLEELARALGR